MKRQVTHATFSIEKTINAPVAKCWAAFSSIAGKKQWFQGPPEWPEDEQTMEFKVGGSETSKGGPKGGPVHYFEARYLDIISESRIVYAYNMFVDDTKLSSSLASITFAVEGKTTVVTMTEHGAYYDGHEDPRQREEGTRYLMAELQQAMEK
ncbi:MAG TPA: SRPBCC family protein [Myxococcota bacterium]